MTLRDALAAALHDRLGVPRLNDIEDAEAILSDPAFREALTEAVAEALRNEPSEWTPYADEARVIVDRMLP